MNKKKVFLCYAREDRKKVLWIYKKLKELGFSPWFDQESLVPGQNWREEIPKAINESDFA